MGKTKVPCMNCEGRHIGCHSECEKYKVFSSENEKKKEEKKKENGRRWDVNRVKLDGMERSRRRYGRREK